MFNDTRLNGSSVNMRRGINYIDYHKCCGNKLLIDRLLP